MRIYVLKDMDECKVRRARNIYSSTCLATFFVFQAPLEINSLKQSYSQ